jgi:hypothetical protein
MTLLLQRTKERVEALFIALGGPQPMIDSGRNDTSVWER